MDIFIIGIISYLMGSIPFGFILTKVFLKKDIREIGSGNIGATNALRTGNKIIGYSTLVLDILKAITPVIYVKIFFQDFVYIAALCAFLGHVFPVWLKFKGGKGVATYLGIIFILSFNLGVIFCVSWILISIASKYSSLSSILSTMIVFIVSFFNNNFELTSYLFITFIIILYTHRQNIVRIKNKSEDKIKL